MFPPPKNYYKRPYPNGPITVQTKRPCSVEFCVRLAFTYTVRGQAQGPKASRGRSKVCPCKNSRACLERWSGRAPRPRSARAPPRDYIRDRRTNLRMTDGGRKTYFYLPITINANPNVISISQAPLRPVTPTAPVRCGPVPHSDSHRCLFFPSVPLGGDVR